MPKSRIISKKKKINYKKNKKVIEKRIQRNPPSQSQRIKWPHITLITQRTLIRHWLECMKAENKDNKRINI